MPIGTTVSGVGKQIHTRMTNSRLLDLSQLIRVMIDLECSRKIAFDAGVLTLTNKGECGD